MPSDLSQQGQGVLSYQVKKYSHGLGKPERLTGIVVSNKDSKFGLKKRHTEIFSFVIN